MLIQGKYVCKKCGKAFSGTLQYNVYLCARCGKEVTICDFCRGNTMRCTCGGKLSNGGINGI